MWLGNPNNAFRSGELFSNVSVIFESADVQTSLVVFRVLESRVLNLPSAAHRAKRSPTFQSSGINYNSHIADHEKMGPCRLVNWYVTFKELNMEKWVISPAGTNVNYCTGSCNLLPLEVNITSHAYISAHYIRRQQKKAPSDLTNPKCVPIKLSPINVIFKRKFGYLLKAIEGMLTESCGCA